MAEYTQGPWRISTGSERWIVQEKGGPIACVEQDRKFCTGNARLIAAAPELLEALDELCRLKQYKEMFGKTEEYRRDQPKAWEKAFAAIAKAEGQ